MADKRRTYSTPSGGQQYTSERVKKNPLAYAKVFNNAKETTNKVPPKKRGSLRALAFVDSYNEAGTRAPTTSPRPKSRPKKKK